ncbi:UNVERIFIED_CONTAM: aconitase X catalytic domain-containing protein, partial [Microbacterium sp. SLM126]
MRLNEEEKAMLAGEAGTVAKMAIEHQIKVGEFFGAEDFVPVTQAHIMADTESLGQAGVMWLERLADANEGGVRIPTITVPRGTDFSKASDLGQAEWMVELERRAIEAYSRLGVSMTDTCINYQTVLAATRGEHVAFGDTGVVIYSNSVGGARSNFEGGPSALSAGLTGRTPRYGYHLDAHRQATLRLRADWTPRDLSEWGALGGVVGRLSGNYWQVPVIEGLDRAPTSDELKHFGAAMASFGSSALFHLVGITPEASRLEDVGGDRLPVTQRIGQADLRGLRDSYAVEKGIDVVVFSAPQLSLFELREIAGLCKGRRLKKPLLAVTSPQVKPDCDR